MAIHRLVLRGSWPVILCLCTAVIIAGVAVAKADTDSSSTLSASTGTPANTTLVAPIGPGDMIHIDVVGEPDLSRDYQVDGNGDITMLYVGKLHVGGLTPDQATTSVTNALGQIYVSPQVTLARSSIGGDTITITGEVMRQGTQAVRRDAHLNDVVQMATPQSDADLSKIQVQRGLPGEECS